MEPRRTNAQGKHNIDIGDFDAFDGSIVVAIKKKGFCPVICAILTRWDVDATQEEQYAGGNWMPTVHPAMSVAV